MKRLLPLLAMSLFAQEFVIKTETRLIIVDLSIKDKSGRPVTTLKVGDLEIYEDGVKQTLKVFEPQKLSVDPLAPVSFAANESKTLEEKAAPVAATATATAKPTAAAPANSVIRYQDKRLLCLFFDMTTMQPPEQARAQDAAIKFLDSQMSASDMVEIMTYTTGIKVVQEWTDNRDILITALKKLTLGEGADLADTGATADENDDSGSFVADDTEFNIFNTDRKLSALQDAAQKLAAFPEKKALVYFSSGISKTGVENQSQIKATVNAAVRANVSFYPIDARGLVATPPGGDASQASSRGTGIISGTKQQSQRNSFNDSQETLVTIAADTGGKVMLDSNDLSMGIRQAQEDISSYYILGYYSTNTAEDGKYRRIDVRIVNKDLSAKLDFRKGYYASKVWGKFNAADKERQLEEALTLGDPMNDLPLALEVDYFRVARDRYSVPISVKIPGSAVQFAKRGSKESVDLDFIGQVRDASGKLVTGVGDKITVSINEGEMAKIGQKHLQYDSVLTLSPGTYGLRFLARENQSGKMGTFETKFTIPDLNSSKTLRVSSVILSNQKEALSSSVGAAETNKKLLANHPLVQDNQKIVPSITRVFRKDQTLYVYFEVYDPSMDAGRKTPSVSAEFELYSGAKKVFNSQAVRLNKLGTSRPGVVPFSFQVPLAKMTAGQYVSQVSVIDETGRKFAFPRNEIVVLPSAAPAAAAPAPAPKQ
jgi:VWFA-related protein